MVATRISRLSGVRGFPVHHGTTCQSYLFIEQKFQQTVHRFGYQNIRIPVVEYAELFYRSNNEQFVDHVDEHVDDHMGVSKELFEFKTKGGDVVALRPEGTAGVARVVAHLGGSGQYPEKVWYCGPMFRYERPQKGRFRQFTQFGVEHFGDDHYLADVECIDLARQTLESIGLNLGKQCKVSFSFLTWRDFELF
jgi:histidyl-tRNA synthetase